MKSALTSLLVFTSGIAVPNGTCTSPPRGPYESLELGIELRDCSSTTSFAMPTVGHEKRFVGSEYITKDENIREEWSRIFGLLPADDYVSQPLTCESELA